MIRIISLIAVVIGVPIMIAEPVFLFLAVGIGLFYLILCKPNCFSSLEDMIFPPRKMQDPESNLSSGEGFITYEEKTRRELSRIPMKKDFKNDPEWQRLSGILKRQAKIAEERENAIMLKAEQNEKCEG